MLLRQNWYPLGTRRPVLPIATTTKKGPVSGAFSYSGGRIRTRDLRVMSPGDALTRRSSLALGPLMPPPKESGALRCDGELRGAERVRGGIEEIDVACPGPQLAVDVRLLFAQPSFRFLPHRNRHRPLGVGVDGIE